MLTRTDQPFARISDGKLTVRIGGTYRLSGAAAHQDLAGRRSTGKLFMPGH